jgi:hypothetical protein
MLFKMRHRLAFAALSLSFSSSFAADLVLPSPFHSSSVTPPVHYAHTPPQNGSSTRLSTFIGVRGASSMELGNAGPYILDKGGEVVWYGGTKSVLNLGRHMYKGEPVLAYYTGPSFPLLPLLIPLTSNLGRH